MNNARTSPSEARRTGAVAIDEGYPHRDPVRHEGQPARSAPRWRGNRALRDLNASASARASFPASAVASVTITRDLAHGHLLVPFLAGVPACEPLFPPPPRKGSLPLAGFRRLPSRPCEGSGGAFNILSYTEIDTGCQIFWRILVSKLKSHTQPHPQGGTP